MNSHFKRADYYSQTDVVKLFKISVKAFKQAILANNITQVNIDINMGDYSMVTVYVAKEDIDKLNLELR